jgi:hypothetical protein
MAEVEDAAEFPSALVDEPVSRIAKQRDTAEEILMGSSES